MHLHSKEKQITVQPKNSPSQKYRHLKEITAYSFFNIYFKVLTDQSASALLLIINAFICNNNTFCSIIIIWALKGFCQQTLLIIHMVICTNVLLSCTRPVILSAYTDSDILYVVFLSGWSEVH